MPLKMRILITLLIGDLAFVGLPLVSWGVTDLRGFTAVPARWIYVVLVLVLNTVAASQMPAAGKPPEQPKTLVRRQRWAVPLLQITTFSLVIAGPWCDRRGIAVLPDIGALRLLGPVLYGLGFGLMHWSQVHLGRQFSIQVSLQEGHRLVTDGPYRFIRHPRYLGITLFGLGLALTFRSWAGLFLAVATLGILLWRIHDEEILLRGAFGDEWDDYVRRSRRLVPLIY